MTLPVWGQQQKSQVDSQTIDEAIAAAIATHEEDPTAHLGDGESLAAHKADEVIDHPASSVVTDKVPDGGLSYRWFPLDRTVVFSNMSESGWGADANNNGFAFQYVGSLELLTGDVSGNYAYASPYPGDVYRLNWDHDWTWQTTLSLSTSADVSLTFGFCNSNLVAGNFDGAFFRVEDGNFYVGVSHDDGTETLTAVSSWTVGSTTFHSFRIQWNYDDQILTFYIDGVEIEALDPPAVQGETIPYASYDLVTNENDRKSINVLDFAVDVAKPGT